MSSDNKQNQTNPQSEPKDSGINVGIDRLTDDIYLSITNYTMVLAAFVIFVLLEFVKVGYNKDVFKTLNFWGAVGVNVILLFMTLLPMATEAERIGSRKSQYYVPKTILQELLARIRRYGHYAKFKTYLNDYNKDIKNEYTDAVIARYGLSLRDDTGVINFTIEDILAKNDLTEEQRKICIKLQRKKSFTGTICVQDFFTTLPHSNANTQVRVSKFNLRLKMMLPKIINGFLIFYVLQSMFFDYLKQPSITVILYILIKMFTIVANVVYGYLGGRRISTEIMPLIFNNRINLIKGFACKYNYHKEYDIVLLESDRAELEAQEEAK